MSKTRIIGYDIANKYVQISYWDYGMNDPETIYLADNENGERLPFQIYYSKNARRWLIDPAENDEELICVDDILNKAINDEKIDVGFQVGAAEILKEFLLQSIQRVYRQGIESKDTYIVFTLKDVENTITILKSTMQDIGFKRSNIYIQDYKETFYDYICSQDKDIWTYGSILYKIENGEIYSCKVQKNRLVAERKRDLITMEDFISDNFENAADKDMVFEEFARNTIGKELVTSVFLIGDEFAGEWYPNTLKYLCAGRKVFGGSNLYSRGACYGGMRKLGINNYNAIYIDNYKITSDISIAVKNRGKREWHLIASQGENWYEIYNSIEVIVDGATSISIRLVDINNSTPREEKIPLDGLFERQRRATRLKISVSFFSRERGNIIIEDVNLGDIMKARGYYLEHSFNIGAM